MRIVFVSFYPAYPPTNGSGAVTYGCAKYVDGDSHIVQVGPKSGEFVTPDGVIVSTVAAGGTEGWRKVLGLRSRIQEIVKRCKLYAPDVIVLEGASWTLYHWLLMRRLRRKCRKALIVYHSHMVEYPWRKKYNGRIVAAVTKFAEGRLARKSDQLFAVSEVDSSEFERLYGVRPPILPNAVDIDRFHDVSPAHIENVKRKYHLSGKTVLFMGLADYKPNKEGIEFLVNNVFDRVREKYTDANLVVIGGKINHKREWLLNPGIISYEDIPAFVCAVSLCVAPVFSGTGTRLKILEYLAASRPVVTTVKGAEGLDLVDQQHLLFAEDAESFAGAIIRLLRDDSFAVDLGKQGHAVVAEQYAWPAIMERGSMRFARDESLVGGKAGG